MSAHDAFAAYIAPARPRNQLWRLLVGLVLVTAVYVALIAALFALVRFAAGADRAAELIPAMARGTTPAGALLLLASFAGMLAGPALAVRLLHRRPVASLFGPWARLARDFVIAAAVVALALALSLAFWRQSFVAEPGLDLATWLRLLPLAALGVLVQTGAEEVLFRGYILQQLAARFRRRLVWIGLPSLAFGAVHFDPTAGSATWLVMAAAFLFGLIAADLTGLTGSLGAAWGFHFANNCFAILVLATKGTIPGLALYLTPYSADQMPALSAVTLTDIAVMLGAWAVLRLVLRR